MQKRFAAALIGRVDLRRCIARILPLVLCCVFMVALSQTAEAADETGSLNFAEACGLELADGKSEWVTFAGGGALPSVKVTNTTTVDDFVKKLNSVLLNYGITVSYDRAAGQLVAINEGGSNVDFVLSLDNGDVLTVNLPSTPSGTSDGMSAFMSAFDTVITLFNSLWTLMLSNPLMTLFLAAGLLVVGVRAFRQLKRAAR